MPSSPSRKRSGFTLIELMIVVAILGALAAVAIPTFVTYVRRAKAAESRDQLKHIFMQAASYYTPERSGQGASGAHRASCIVEAADNGVVPSDAKQAGDYSAAAWQALGYSYGYSYFRFEIAIAGAARCQVPAASAAVYTFRALGDLDGDGATSLLELAAGSNEENELYHSRGFYVVAETE